MAPSDSKSTLALDERLAQEAQERRAILQRRQTRMSLMLDKERLKALDVKYEARSFNIVLGLLLALMCSAFVFCLRDVYDDDMPTEAKTFRKSVNGTLQATVLEQGYSYTGDCPMHQRPDAPGTAADCELSDSDKRTCIFEYYQELPVDRRLQAGGDEDDRSARAAANASESRALYEAEPGKCYNEWVPWYKVRFSIDDETYERCSYRLGSKLNSQDADWWRVHAWSHENPLTVAVWETTSPEHCIVGFATLEELDEFFLRQRNAQTGILLTMYLFAGFAMLSCCFSVRYYFHWIDPNVVPDLD